MLRAVLLRFLILVPLCIGGLSMAAAAAGLPPSDEQVIRSVQLDESLLDKLSQIRREGDDLGAGSDNDSDELDLDALESLDAMARHLTRDRRAAPMLARHGLTAQQYVAAQLALMRAALAARMGASAAEADRHGTTADNIAFARKHMPRIEAIFGEDAEEAD